MSSAAVVFSRTNVMFSFQDVSLLMDQVIHLTSFCAFFSFFLIFIYACQRSWFLSHMLLLESPDSKVFISCFSQEYMISCCIFSLRLNLDEVLSTVTGHLF